MTTEHLPRRQFLRGKFFSSLKNNTEQTQGINEIRPPWAMENRQFIADCTRCGDCLAQCETQIIIKGEGGFPAVDFSQGECTFCGRCAEICQQPIFHPRETQPWVHKIHINAQCLTQHRIECRTCQDSCPTGAIRFRLQLGGVAQPQVNFEECNGCGACLAGCPVSAITISNLKQND